MLTENDDARKMRSAGKKGAATARKASLPGAAHAIRCALATALLLAANPAAARVTVIFHSTTGSWFGKFPHAFIEMVGTLDGDTHPIHENYGYTARNVGPEILSRNVEGIIESENDAYIKSSNTHFSLEITNEQYRLIREEIVRWHFAPGKAYNLNTHNCVNFVARIAEIAGLKVDVPEAMEKRPKAWLDYIKTLNPGLR